MWKARVRTCLGIAIEELRAEQARAVDFNATIRTELEQMVVKSRLEDHVKRLQEILAEIEATPDKRPPRT